MGKASKWFRGLLRLNKKPTPQPSSISPPSPNLPPKPPKKKWSFTNKSNNKEKDNFYSYIKTPMSEKDGDPSKQAIVVAAATAAAAEVAVAAAHAAAEVVRLTSSGRATSTMMFHGGEDVGPTAHFIGNRAGYASRHHWAAVKIQSYFRAYLARRALRALKALVKIQALVRGHIVRKRTTDNIRRVHALLRVQARALARRSLNFGSQQIDNKYTHPGRSTKENSEHVARVNSMKHDGSMMLKRNGSRSDVKAFSHQGRVNVAEQGPFVKHRPTEDERSDKILEVDPGIHRTPPKRRNLFYSSHLSLCSDQYSQSFTTSKDSTTHQTIPSPSIYEVQSLGHFKLSRDLEDGYYFTAESSPQFYSATSKDASSRRGPFTPTKSEDSVSCHSVYSEHRNYMSLTESSKAKMRSLSAPRHRPQYERSSSAKRYSTPSYHNDSRMNPQRNSGSDANFTNKVYPGSGYLDRLGMPTSTGH